MSQQTPSTVRPWLPPQQEKERPLLVTLSRPCVPVTCLCRDTRRKNPPTLPSLSTQSTYPVNYGYLNVNLRLHSLFSPPFSPITRVEDSPPPTSGPLYRSEVVLTRSHRTPPRPPSSPGSKPGNRTRRPELVFPVELRVNRKKTPSTPRPDLGSNRWRVPGFVSRGRPFPPTILNLLKVFTKGGTSQEKEGNFKILKLIKSI